MWPRPTSPEVFDARRRRLAERLTAPAIFAAGSSRARNFPHNRFPFRAESHFLYLVGRSIESAALVVSSGEAVIYAPRPDPGDALWSGPTPSLDDLAKELGVEVRPLEDLHVPNGAATLPPQDPYAADWLSELLDRDVDPESGDTVSGADAALADAMIELRLRHDEAAVDQMRQAAAVTERAHRAGMRATRPSLREAAVRAAMEAEIFAAGMTTSYNSIVTVHGEVLHNVRYDHEIGDADLVLADVGAETPEGWAADVTRTWPAASRFSPTQRAVYEVVLDAQKTAITAVRPGVRYRDIHRTAGRRLLEGLLALGLVRGDADELFERGTAALFFPHGIGHLLGLDVHDMEDLGDRAGYAPGRSRGTSAGDRFLRLDRDLEPGMVVTIEPGLYWIPSILDDPAVVGDLEDTLERTELARFSDVRGIRIEDDVLVTAGGCEILTAGAPKEPDEVEALRR